MARSQAGSVPTQPDSTKTDIQTCWGATGDLGNKNTPRIVWEMRIKDLEEEGAFTDGSGLYGKAYSRTGSSSGSLYLGL